MLPLLFQIAQRFLIDLYAVILRLSYFATYVSILSAPLFCKMFSFPRSEDGKMTGVRLRSPTLS